LIDGAAGALLKLLPDVHLAAQGIYGGGKRPFGFDVVGEGKAKRLVSNEAEQAVIAKMRAMRGVGPRDRKGGRSRVDDGEAHPRPEPAEARRRLEITGGSSHETDL
jgi:hypothetical protein